jgi:dipeptidyl aminopeptidase/acylaminoacyl peptidase
MDANQVFGWSPDDQTFAFFWDYKLYFWAASGGKSDGGTDTNGICAFAWLSPESCAYIDDAQHLMALDLVNGRWQTTFSHTLPRTNGVPRELVATGSRTVAWTTDNVLWAMDFSSGKTTVLYFDPQKQIASASWSPKTGTFLLTVNARARNGRDNQSSLTMLASDGTSSVVKQLAGREMLTEARWINDGRGYAWVTEDGDNSFLTVKPDNGAMEQRFFSGGRVEKVVVGGDPAHVYAFAISTNEPPGLWCCSLGNGKLNYALPPWGYQKLALNFQPAMKRWVPWGRRHSQSITLIPPANFSRHKKYPLIIALDSYTWIDTGTGTYAQTLANAGACVVFSDYHYNPRRYNLENIHDYTNIVLAIYRQMAASPNIDTHRVFLFGPCFVTYVMSDLVRDDPGRWQGIMLCSPTSLPAPQAGMTEKVIATTVEGQSDTRFPKYQADLFQVGIPMDWHVYADDGHVERAQNTMQHQARVMAKMVFGE